MKMENSSFMQGFTESYLADLGRVVAAWSHVEHLFSILFLSVVVMKGPSGSMADPTIQKLMGLPFGRKLKAFRARLKELVISDETLTHTSRILDQLLTLSRQRNEIAHSVWNLSIKQQSPNKIEIVHDEAVTLYKSWEKGNPTELKFKTVKQNHLKEIFEKIHALYWDLVQLSLDQGLRSHRQRQPLS